MPADLSAQTELFFYKFIVIDFFLHKVRTFQSGSHLDRQKMGHILIVYIEVLISGRSIHLTVPPTTLNELEYFVSVPTARGCAAAAGRHSREP